MRFAAVAFFLLVLSWSNGCGDGGGNGGTGLSNHPPVIEAQGDTSVVLGDTLVLWARASDTDSDELSYTVMAHITYEEFARGYQPDAWMNRTSGRFRFRPQADDSPQRRFTFSANDGRGGADSTTFNVSVY